LTVLAPSGRVPDGASGPDPVSEVTARGLLDSGLRVVTERVPGARSASVGVWIGVGSRDETSGQAGAAHYLEHLLFKGTARRSAADIAEAIDAVGGELNAFTAKEHTCFYAHVLDSDLPLAVDLLADVVTRASMTAADVEVERAVVLEEIAMRGDDPEDLLGEVFDTALYGDHPLGRPVIGSGESVEAMTRARLRNFWRRHYTPERMVVAAAGNIEHDQVLRLVDDAFAAARPAAAARSGPGRPPRRPRGGPALRGEDTEQVHLMLGLPGLDRHDPRRIPLEVLNAVLGGGMSSRLFQQVREQRGLVYSVYSSTTSYAETGEFSVYAGCRPDRLAEVAELIRAVLDDAARTGITEAELARAKGGLRGGLVLGLEDTASRMHRIGRNELELGRQQSLTESLAEIDAVRPDEVAEIAADLLRGPLTTAVVGPYDGTDQLPPALRGLPALGG
jgi:predicted Zn-dependent peptidase